MFAVAADSYDRFMGRYSEKLSAQLADLAGVGLGQRVLDVGCGTGALTAELVQRVGTESVAAVDPSPPFVAAVRERYPGVEVHQASAEQLPFSEARFDATLAQLVVHFMTDPVAGIAEMKRVTRPGGVVAACVWDYGGRRGPLSPFWQAARQLDPEVPDESERAGTREGHLAQLFSEAGLGDIHQTTLSVTATHKSFEEWWEPFQGGVGPAGVYLQSIDPERRQVVETKARQLLEPAPFTLTGYAWAVTGRV